MLAIDLDSIKTYDLTWQEVLSDQQTGRLLIERGYDPMRKSLEVYAIRDSIGAIVYIGRSRNLVERLKSHLYGFAGQGFSSSVGDYIQENMPASLNWTITLYEVDGIVEGRLIAKHNPWFNSNHRSATGTPPTPIKRSSIERGLTDNLF